jgi:hydroxyethylthiazole kinase-like uncharacterized protein yjeF
LEYVTPEAMRELEKEASSYGLSVKDLMENAGRGVAEFILSRFGPGKRVCVVCGGGNNGGDGLVAARYLSGKCEVKVVMLTRPDKIRTAEARENWSALSGARVEVRLADTTESLMESSRLITDAEVVVAAIFGTGVKGGAVAEPYATAISLVNSSTGARVAVDLPSGIDPGTGAASQPSVRADITLALHLPKVGLKGREEFTGELVVLPIGIRAERREGRG